MNRKEKKESVKKKKESCCEVNARFEMKVESQCGLKRELSINDVQRIFDIYIYIWFGAFMHQIVGGQGRMRIRRIGRLIDQRMRKRGRSDKG